MYFSFSNIHRIFIFCIFDTGFRFFWDTLYFYFYHVYFFSKSYVWPLVRIETILTSGLTCRIWWSNNTSRVDWSLFYAPYLEPWIPFHSFKLEKTKSEEEMVAWINYCKKCFDDRVIWSWVRHLFRFSHVYNFSNYYALPVS